MVPVYREQQGMTMRIVASLLCLWVSLEDGVRKQGINREIG